MYSVMTGYRFATTSTELLARLSVMGYATYNIVCTLIVCTVKRTKNVRLSCCMRWLLCGGIISMVMKFFLATSATYSDLWMKLTMISRECLTAVYSKTLSWKNS